MIAAVLLTVAQRSRAQNPSPDVTLTGVIQGANGLPAANTLLSFTPTQTFYIVGSGYGGCAGGTLFEHNGTALTNQCLLNFNDTTPAAPAGSVNVTFQTDSNGNLSAYVPAGGGGGCGPLSTDSTSTNCGTGNRVTDTSTVPAYIQTYGDANMVTNSSAHALSAGDTNLTAVDSGGVTSQLVALGSNNGDHIYPNSSDLIFIGDSNWRNGSGTGSSASGNVICIGQANCTNMYHVQSVIGIGYEAATDFPNNSGSGQSSDILAMGWGVASSNSPPYVFSSDTAEIFVYGENSLQPAHTGATAKADFSIIALGEGSGHVLGTNVNDIVIAGDEPASALPDNSHDIVAFGNGADHQCESFTFTGCSTSNQPNPVAHNDVVFIGGGPGLYNQGSFDIGIGRDALGCCAGVTYHNSGTDNTAVGGREILATNTTGINNTAYGSYAGSDGYVESPFTLGNSNTTGSNNTWIGYDSGPHVTTQLTNSSALGYQAANDASNQIVLGNSSVTQFRVPGIKAASVTSCLQIDTTGNITNTGAACGSGGGGAVNSVANSDGTLTITPTTGAVVASLALGHANTWTALQTFSAGINLSGSVSPFELGGSAGTSGQCLISAGTSATPTWGTCGSGGGVTGSGTTGYIPAWTGSTAIGNSHMDDGVTTAGTITSSEPVAITGSTHGLTIPAGTAVSGVVGKVVYASDATNGYAEVNENNTGLSRICTVANGLCVGSSTNAPQTWQALNYGTGGTTVNLAACWQNHSNLTNGVVVCPTSAQGGTNINPPVAGVVTAGAGTTGLATVQYQGNVSWICDNLVGVGDMVFLSSSTAGECHDAVIAGGVNSEQLNENPETNTVLGVVVTANAGAGTAAIINLMPLFGGVQGAIQTGQGFALYSVGSPYPRPTYWSQNSSTASGSSGSPYALIGANPIDLFHGTGIFEINPGNSGLGSSGRDVVFDSLTHGFGFPPNEAMRFNGSTYNVPTVASVTGAEALDVSSTTGVYVWTLTGNTTLSTPTDDNAGHILTFDLVQAASGGPYTFTWPSNFKNPPTISTVASSSTVASFLFDGTNYWYLGNGAMTTQGSVALSSGTATVSTTAAIAVSGGHYILTNCGASGTAIGTLSVGTVTVGTSFVINSLTAANAVATGDNSTVCWWIK